MEFGEHKEVSIKVPLVYLGDMKAVSPDLAHKALIQFFNVYNFLLLHALKQLSFKFIGIRRHLTKS